MAEVKTKPTKKSVETYLDGVREKQKRDDSDVLLRLMRQITKRKPVMWGPSIIGFGSYHYIYESGRERDWLLTGFSPRKQGLVIYVMSGFGKFDGLMKKLGTFKTGKSCLYVRRLEDVNIAVLKSLITASVAATAARHK